MTHKEDLRVDRTSVVGMRQYMCKDIALSIAVVYKFRNHSSKVLTISKYKILKKESKLKKAYHVKVSPECDRS